MPDYRRNLPQFLIKGYVKSHAYKSTVPRPQGVSLPPRDRGKHANHLLNQLKKIVSQLTLPVKGEPAPKGIYLDIEGKEAFDLTMSPLNSPSKGIELLVIKEEGEGKSKKMIATVFVPTNQVKTILNKIEEYRDKNTKKDKPKNQPLVTSIENIKHSILKSLWTDSEDQFPSQGEKIWWEIWLRSNKESIPRFQEFAKAQKLQASNRILKFPDRHIVLAYMDTSKMAKLVEYFDIVAELRRAKEATSDFLEMNNFEQVEWATALIGLTNELETTAPIVCVLDTGIHRQHLLINKFLKEADTFACDSTWRLHDHSGHGTRMAGVILYGDLSEALQSTERLNVPCSLNSVKILPPTGRNKPDLFGGITEDAIKIASKNDSNKNRIICMAITTLDNRDRGKPSTWSASVDKICAGEVVNDKKYLFIVSAGNAKDEEVYYLNYPASNLTDGIHDPAQAWNALTVGAFTEKDIIKDTSFSGWLPLAKPGDLSPFSTTSQTWQKSWPLKPEVVFEGGNLVVNPTGTNVDSPTSMSILTTSRETLLNQFTWTDKTSAASALATNFAARIMTKAPKYWPETVRALMIHSSDWTAQMRQSFAHRTKSDKELLIRACGYGVPDFDKAIACSTSHLTLIAQEEIQPFKDGKMNELHLHNLPWPIDVLKKFEKAKVVMTVTLSYFIEPNPAARSRFYKFKYQSHGLRFEVKTGTESIAEFMKRINKENWESEDRSENITSKADSDSWFLGKDARSRGSVHKDIWTGTAASLSEMGSIAVFPVSGWWKDKKDKSFANKKSRYSLVVSISTSESKLDVYTPVETAITTKIEI